MTGQQEGRRPVTGRRNRRALAGPMAVIALVGVALTVLSSVAARDGTVSAPERSVFEAINGLPDWLDRPMWAFQLLGVLVAPVLIAVVLLVLRRWRPALALLLLVPLKLVAERQVLKQLVERQRPGQTETNPILRDVPPAGLSFPSGHAIVVFAVAVLVAPYLRGWWRAVPFALAAIACVSRVYLGAHNPLDVVAGAGAGLLLGGLLTLLVGVPAGRPTGRHRGSPARTADGRTVER
jgi:membrane-associated phospholipid phosphatase